MENSGETVEVLSLDFGVWKVTRLENAKLCTLLGWTWFDSEVHVNTYYVMYQGQGYLYPII